MPRSQRRIVASFVLLVFLAIWIWGASTIGSHLATGPKWVSLVFFVVAGIGWVLPLRPLFKWMNAGPEEEDS